MLPVLTFLVASCALASAGVVNVKQYNYNAVLNDNSLIGRALHVIDGSDVGVHELYLADILRDLANLGGNQDLVSGQSVAALGELVTGIPGDACVAANYINAFTRYASTGNPAGLREALASYVQLLNEHIDNLARFINDRNSARYASGSRGGCPGGGRTFDFEPAWDIILGSVPAHQLSLVAEEYSVAKRQYCGHTAISSNLAAQLTASSLPPSLQIFDLSSRALNEFLTRFAAKSNINQAAASLKQAFSSAVGRVNFKTII